MSIIANIEITLLLIAVSVTQEAELTKAEQSAAILVSL